MEISVEISLYPLQDNNLEIINEFIDSLNKIEGLKVESGQMSTIIKGDSDIIFKIMKDETTKIFEKSSSVFNLKISNCCQVSCKVKKK